MSKVTVLGGSGVVGSIAAKTLTEHDCFTEVVIADYNIYKAHSIANQLNSSKISATFFDVFDRESLRRAIQGSDVVLNCVGPFYKTVKNILDVVLEEKINYVDICDDEDVTIELLNMDEKVKNAGITALIGMGNSPGATNVISRLAADTLLDEVDTINIFHTHGGEPEEGPGVIGHRFHCMTSPLPVFIDGSLKYIDYFGEEGIALREVFNFPLVGETLIYPYPHPEQITIPQHIKVRNVTNKGSVLPEEYYNLIRDLCWLGLYDQEPVNVKGQEITPYDFALAYIIRERDKILKKTNFGQQRGCTSVLVKGTKDGNNREYRFHMASASQALGEGTGIPAAIGTILMGQGKIDDKGLMPPEACINPQEFLSLVTEIMQKDSSGKEGGFEKLQIEKVDEHGQITPIEF